MGAGFTGYQFLQYDVYCYLALLVARDKRLGKNKYEPVSPYGYLITV